MGQAYLLLTGSKYCEDADDFYGIYTDKEKLKEGIEILKQWWQSENSDQIMVYAFELNEFSGIRKRPDFYHGICERYLLDEHAAEWHGKTVSELFSEEQS